MEYCGSIWDPSAKDEIDRLEIIQRCAARWARGAHGIISVTALLSDLNWASLADRRKNKRLSIFYKILNGEWDIDSKSVDIVLDTNTSRRKSHHLKVKRISGSDQNSPIWKGTIAKTIPEWNSLPVKTVSAGSALSFRDQLCAKR